MSFNHSPDRGETQEEEEEEVVRVCAMCVKEPALPDPKDDSETIDDILAKETRRIRLRELRAMERKLTKKNDSKQQGEESEEGADDDNGLESENEKDENSVESDNDNDEDNDDPLLRAVGGADQLLTGEAYRKKKLLMQEQEESKTEYQSE
mmetsp:Transcript_7616/g.17491  ORF Transcript_7616/g.17491 Transcript_7616/m.17491 type:complete len:151 (+) Transcript_7616:83-535(+)